MNTVIQDYKNGTLFYTLATVLPWSLWGIAAYISHAPGISRASELASVLAFVGLLAPALVALMMIYSDERLKSDFLHRLLSFGSGSPVYWLLTMFLMPASILLAQAISLLFGYPVEQFAFSEHYSFSSGVFPVWFLLIAAPVIEELAWHSYGTDCLVNRLSLFRVSIIFALFWGLWHMPLSFINDYYHSNLVETGSLYGINFLVSIFPFVIIMNWLYYKTGRSILATMVFHVTAGYFNEIFATHPDSKLIQTGLLTVFACIILFRERDIFFGRFDIHEFARIRS